VVVDIGAICAVVAVVNPNNKFEIYVDQTLIHSGSLLEDMTLVLVTVIGFVCVYCKFSFFSAAFLVYLMPIFLSCLFLNIKD